MTIETLRFMVVEDHGFQRWVTGNILEKLGAAQVVTAADGRVALETLADMRPPIDIVVSDLDMPGMDGMEFIRKLGESWKDVSLIVVSSLDRTVMEGVETMARAYGVDVLGSLEKPPNPKKLLALVERYKPPTSGHAAPAGPAFHESEIAEGLRRGEFEAFFQPKVALATRELRGAEANARWRHPRSGVLPAAVFIGALEAAGVMEELTGAIVKSAARHCATWRNAGLEIPVSVNLSLTSLEDLSLADRMVNLVMGQGLDVRQMIFEVTESAAAGDVGRVLENLTRLRMKGFGLSIDDYGTGYSSMERLSRGPFTELKIDQGFVRDACTQPSRRAMLESSLEMAAKLRIPAVAEGVENQAQWDLLRELRCEMAQGYFVAKPMQSGEFLQWAEIRKKATVG
ncbi:MAG TPA: EAL domain-containing response regulator [Usitatibacter sp.]|nr:EAL domain-containing response regulator [Usitatibacter sp.]